MGAPSAAQPARRLGPKKLPIQKATAPLPTYVNTGAVMVTPPGLEPGTNSTKNCCATDYTTGYRAKSLASGDLKSSPTHNHPQTYEQVSGRKPRNFPPTATASSEATADATSPDQRFRNHRICGVRQSRSAAGMRQAFATGLAPPTLTECSMKELLPKLGARVSP